MVNWDGGGGNSSWHTPENWSADRVPGSADDVRVPAGFADAIIFSSGLTTIRSLDCAGALRLTGGRLALSGGGSRIAGALSLSGSATLRVNGSGTELVVEGAVSVAGGTIECLQGAVCRLPGLTALDIRTRHVTLSVANSGSLLAAPTLMSVLQAEPYTLTLEALSGGRLECPALARLEGDAALVARGAGTTLDLSGLGGVWANTNATRRSSLEVSDGAEVRMPGLTGLRQVDVTLRKAGAGAPLAGLVSFERGELQTQDTTNAFPGLARFVDGSLDANAGSWLSLPLVSTVEVTTGVATLAVAGPSSRVAFSGASALIAAGTARLDLEVSDGGILDLGQVTRREGRTTVRSEDAGSLVDLSGLAGVWSHPPSTTPAVLEVAGGGEIRAPGLTGLHRTELILRDAGSRFPTAGLASLVEGELRVERATHTFPALTRLEQAEVVVAKGAVCRFPALTGLTLLTGNRLTLRADGAGSALDLSQLERVAMEGNALLDVTATDGGVVDLSRLANPTGRVLVEARGAGSVVDLSSVQGLWRNETGTWPAGLVVEAAGTIRIPGVTGLERFEVRIRDTGQLALEAVRSLAQCRVTLDAVTAAFPALTDRSTTTFVLWNGGQAVFPPAADLVVTDIRPPAAAAAGDLVTLAWTVRNQGTNATAGGRSDAVALSPNRAVGADLFLGHFADDAVLGPGEARTRTNTVLLPAGLSGTQYFVVTADSRLECFEDLAEDNNSLAAATGTVLSAADLEVADVAAPPTARLGDTLRVSWVVTNSGTVPAGRSWTDRLYLAANPTNLTGARTLLNRPAMATLPAGARYTNTADVLLPGPRETAPGPRYLVAFADVSRAQPEAVESNNTRAQAITIEPPPMPDLAVLSVVAPSSAEPGVAVPVVWGVTNRGAAIARGVWTETLSASNAPGVTLELARLDLTNALDPGALLWRTQTVVFPVTGPAGAFVVTAHADRFDEVAESDETNNRTAADPATTVPLRLGLVLAASAVAEQSPVAVRAAITRNGPADQSLTVSFASSDPGEVAAPAPVVLASGVSAGVVEFRALPDGAVDGPQAVRLTATAPGFPAGESTLEVLDSDRPGLTLVPVASEMLEGRTMGVRVTRPEAGAAPLTVTVASEAPGQLSPPLTVTIPAGSAFWDFLVLAVDDTLVEPPLAYAVTASAPGLEPGAAALTILDNDLPSVTLTLADSAVGEGAGNQATRGTITRDPVSSRALTVAIENSDVTAAVAPLRVVIPANQASAGFPVAAVDDSQLDGPQTAVFSPRVLASGSDVPVAGGTGATLVVRDDDGPGLRVEVQPGLVAEGLASAGTVTVFRNTPPVDSLAVSLVSGDPATAVVPATVVLPSGAASVSVPFSTVADAAPAGNRGVTFTASAAGHAGGSATVVVTDVDLPDLVVRDVIAPATAYAGLRATLGYRVANQGLSATATNFLIRVLVSRDPVPGDDVLLHQQRFAGTLAVGQEVTQSLPLELPSAPGAWWLIVEADAGHEVAEGLEDNNTGVAAQPTQLQTEYTATAWTDTELAPPGTEVVVEGTVQFAAGRRDHVPVDVHLSCRGTERVLRATTMDGNRFFVRFRPLPGEAGTFGVFAAAPGVPAGEAQDTFQLLGLKPVPATSSFRLAEGGTFTRAVALRNLGDVALTGLSAVVTDAPPGLEVRVEPAATTVPPHGTLAMPCTFTARTPDASGTVDVEVTAAGGVSERVHFAVRVDPLTPRLTATPSRPAGGMLRGRQTPVEVELANEGGVATGPLTVVLPETPWLSLAEANPLAALAPGETRRLTLLLTPAADLPLGPYAGAFTINATNAGLTVPFEFRAVSDARGDLEVTVVDEFTFYAEGAPRVAGAKVVVRDAYAYADLRTALADEHGVCRFEGLPEGPYEVEVNADNHVGHRSTVQVGAGRVEELIAFISRTTVRYNWTVEPVQIEDRYRITVETTFETAVPVPVVTMEPKLVELADFAGAGGTIEFRIENHGLIAAQALALRVPLASAVQFPTLGASRAEDGYLIIELGDLPARGALRLPARVTGPGPGAALAGRTPQDPAPADGAPCSYEVDATWQLTCGYVNLEYATSTTVYTGAPGCGKAFPSWTPGPSGSGKPPRRRVPAWGTGEGIWVTPSPPPWQASTTCDPDCLVRAGLGCAGGPLGEAIGIQQCISGLFDDEYNPLKYLDCTVTGLGMLPGGDMPACAYDVLRCFMEFTPLGAAATAATRTRVELHGGPVPPGAGTTATASGDTLAPYRAAMRAYVDLLAEITGKPYGDWWKPEDGFGNRDSALRRFARMIEPGSEDGRAISTAEWINYVNSPEIEGVEPEVIDTFRFRWNYTLDAWSHGVYGPTGTNGNVIDFERLRELALAYKAGHEWAVASGYADPLVAILDTVRTLASSGENGGICARVKFRTEQEAVLTRDAFRATLELDNQDLLRLENVAVALEIVDEAGRDATARFALRPPELTGLSGVEGSGILAAGVTGTARWLIIPTVEAAPEVETRYFVTGRFRYTLAGTEVSVPLALAPITVRPGPRLVLHYFHERDVFSDDPFTSEIEPRVPFNLAVLVQNLGRGPAYDFRIRSGQPQIVENEKGLLIDYQILATEVTGQPVSPGLTADFGDLAPGATAVGRWLFGSSLQGMFTDYQASFEHLDAMGEPRLSLIDHLSIHELIHLVQAGGTFEDGRPDFLANDVPDLYDRPDTLHLSDGTSHPVTMVEQAAADGVPDATNLTVTLTASLPPGWSCLRVPDPGAGRHRLARVTRPDGSEIAFGTNVWVTDRTFLGLGRRPTYETVLHLLDHDSPGAYTLTYREASTDTTPPSSQILPLAARSGGDIAVAWTGDDGARGSGIAGYDLYVSEDDGPFLLWLAQTSASGAVFAGRLGHSYGFFSVATDAAGNVEAIPGAPDTRTEASLVNRPPTADGLADQVLDEGGEFRLALPAGDPDLPADRLRFSLISAPVGLVLDPDTGLARWLTTEASGPGHYRLEYRVADSGTPPLLATGAVQLIVREVNLAPALTVPTNRVLNEGRRLTLPIAARDFDLPANPLRFALGPGQPAGATLDPVSGVFDWQPTETQGPSTNRILVSVTDDGQPPLSVTGEFLIVVRDTLSELTVALGSTNVLAGETALVPLTVSSGLELETLRVELEIGPGPVAPLAVIDQADELAYLVLEPGGSGRYALELGFEAGRLGSGTRPVAWLGLSSVTGHGSGVVPLRVRGVTAWQAGGVAVGHAAGQDGRLIVVEREPVLEVAPAAAGSWQMRLYGVPGARYVTETAPALGAGGWVPGAAWSPGDRVLFQELPLTPGVSSGFLRVREVP